MEFPIIGMWWPLALLVLGWLVYLGITWNHEYWEKRGVPYIKPLPLFGNVKDSILMRKSMGEVLQELYEKFDGYKYVGIFSPTKPSLLIRDPDLIKDIMVKDFTSFHDNDLQVDMDTDPIAGRNPFLLKGDRWKVTRSRLLPAFTLSKLRTTFPLIQEVCQELKELIKNNDVSGEFEAKELCARFTTDVVTTCAFGIHGNSLKNPDSDFRKMGRAMLDTRIINTIKFMLVFFMPSLSNIIRLRFVPKKVEDFFVQMVKEVKTYRKENNVTRNDYIQLLINIKNMTANSMQEKYPFQDIDIAAQATTFFFDGFETSSVAFSFTLYALATNPHVQTKLRAEVNSIMKEDGGQLTYDGIQKMTYLDMVLSESLRLYSPLYFLTRQCTEPVELETPSGGKFTVEKGTSIHIPIYAIHRDPKHYPDPYTFDPERFSEKNKKSQHRFAYLPFGEGPRICLGMRFAIMQVKAGIAAIVSSFEISKTSRTQVPFVPDPNNLIHSAKGGLWLQFREVSSTNHL